MNSKTIVLLRKVIISEIIVLLVILGLFLIFSGMSPSLSLKEFLRIFVYIIPVSFFVLLAFYGTYEWLQNREKLSRPYTYFPFLLLIPITISGIISILLHYFLQGMSNPFSPYPVPLYHLVFDGAMVIFLAIIYYIQHNYKNYHGENIKINWNKKEVYKKILLSSLCLSLLFGIAITVIKNGYNLNFFLIDLLRQTIVAICCWYIVLNFKKYVKINVSFIIEVLINIFIAIVAMQFIIPVLYLIQFSFIMGRNLLEIPLIFGINQFDSIYILFCVLFYQLFYFSTLNKLEKSKHLALMSKASEKYNVLRKQLSPHFLFNNINVLTALIEENPQKAVRFSESLGNIYRHFLRQEDEDVVSLQSALSFSKDYLELLKYRYEEAFQYVLPEAVASNQYIIPLVLQQVIENTIKHNEVSREKPLQITIGIQNDYIIIQNTKQLKTTVENTKGTGIENIQKRYAFLTEKEVVIEDEVNSFTIKLPLLNMENA